jgi:ribosomal protein S18 acetylase RimI-like enzyme
VLQVRPATLDDVAAVVALVESAYRGESSRAGWTTEADLLVGQRTDAAAVAEAVSGPDRLVLVAAGPEDGGLVGCCELQVRAGGCYFGMFAVSPGRQGSGLGSSLLAAAERHATDRLGAARMEMTVIGQRPELIAWYERRGYRRTGETRPFPYGDERFGLPRRPDLRFVVLAKSLCKHPQP